jgi:uncharacterized protein YjbI with pentapeptide repeats
MADAKLLDLIHAGVDMWNTWRRENQLSGSIDVSTADLRAADLSNADLRAADLRGADLSGAQLRGARLRGTSLYKANLSGAYLRDANLYGADLASADLRAANLHKANLSGAILSNAILVNAKLEAADLSRARLVRTNSIDANFRGANLSQTDLFGADLSGAIFVGAILRFTNVQNTTFHLANFGSTLVADVDLGGIVGLQSVKHLSPSSIGIDTLFRSKGNIPEPFLRGAGVPDALIAYSKSLIGSAIEFYSLFISYSSLDQEFADRLYADLQAKGVRCWFAPHDIQGGRKVYEQIDEAIRLHDKLLLILSPHSMASEWVMTEISKARRREVHDGARVLFPISLLPFERIRDWECFDADTGKDSAREVREYYIPDFSNWKDHDSYQKAFDRLLKNLQAAPIKNH